MRDTGAPGSSGKRAPKMSTLGERFESKRRSQGVEKSKIRVLIVDDEDPVRRFVDRVLRDAGYSTSVAAGGPEAIALASREEPFDLLVTDLMMPQMSGDELSRRLRQSESELKVLYLTGYSDRLFREKVTLWADEAFLDKPPTVEGLREAVSLLVFGRIQS
jgi:two-component system, cell cycle sensor histidine kinase and response regulator CckA